MQFWDKGGGIGRSANFKICHRFQSLLTLLFVMAWTNWTMTISSGEAPIFGREA